MVFALLIAAILWNLGTWWFGLPASSSHTMVGSIIGVGIANQLMIRRQGTSGVDWDQARTSANRCCSHRWSALFGRRFSHLPRLLSKTKALRSPEGTEPPPFGFAAC